MQDDGLAERILVQSRRDDAVTISDQMDAGMAAVYLDFHCGGALGLANWHAPYDPDQDIPVIPYREAGEERLFVLVQRHDPSRAATVDVLTCAGVDADDTSRRLAGGEVRGGVLDDAGGEHVFGGAVDEVAAIVSNDGMQTVFPNPFNPSVTLSYSIKVATHGPIDIYDVAGRLVRTLVDEDQAAGAERTAVWNGRNQAGSTVASGVYVWKLSTERQTQSGRVMMLNSDQIR
ncbi:MAG: T9SS type A sorting domain-containing protein [Candidatus Krumholzibacteriia bacterium]